MEKEYFNTTGIVMKSVNDKTRVVEFIASKEIVDRGGDVINIKGIDLKNFKKNPVILWSHNRSEEHTSELQSHSFISYAVFCLKKKKQTTHLSLLSTP